MLAVVKDPSKTGIALEEVPIPEFSPYEVLIQVKAVGICGSDLRIYNKTDSGRRRKYILGHELSGEVIDWGAQVHEFKKGDRVATEICIGCGICRYCKRGLINLCKNLNEVGITMDGGMAQYISVPARNVHLIPETLSFEEATLADPLACSIRGLELARIDPESWVAILGPGPIGLFAIQVAKRILRAKVIVTGTNEARLELARAFGADYAFDVRRSDPVEEILQITDGGVDYTFEAAGDPKALQQAIRITRKNGGIVVMTVHREIQMDLEPLIRHELTIHGSICYNYKEFDQAIDLIAKKKIEIEFLVKNMFPLREAEKAFQFALSRKGIKVILNP
jgi:threonine dehydrogenase-like Zn-dependent dehydrogenase